MYVYGIIACVCVFVCFRPATPSKTPPPEDSTSPSPAPTPPPSEPVSELKLTEPHKFEIPRLKSAVKKVVLSPTAKSKRSVFLKKYS